MVIPNLTLGDSCDLRTIKLLDNKFVLTLCHSSNSTVNNEFAMIIDVQCYDSGAIIVIVIRCKGN